MSAPDRRTIVTSKDGKPTDSTNPFPVSLDLTIATLIAALVPTDCVFLPIACATLGDNTLLGAQTAKKIRVMQIAFSVNADTDLYFADGAGTVIYGGSSNKQSIAAKSGFVLPFSPIGWFETAASQLLKLNLSAANKATGVLAYRLI
jgi:hypothetical protein